MKYGYLSVIILGSLLSTSSHADFQFGLKAGSMQVGFDDADTSEDPVSVAATLGYSLDFVKGMSLEAEVSRTVSAGEVSGNDLEVDSQGIYIAYETAGTVYVKGRVGFMDASLSAGELSEDEGGETYGIAVGWRLTGFDLELGYTAVDDDVTFISLGARF